MKTTVTTIEGQRYQFKKMLPHVATHIYMHMLGAVLEGRKNEVPQEETSEPKKMSAEDRVRALVSLAFMKCSLDDIEDFQRQAATVTTRLEVAPNSGADMPMPIWSNGRWVDSTEVQLNDNPALVHRIVMEALVFSLSPFFAQSESI